MKNDVMKMSFGPKEVNVIARLSYEKTYTITSGELDKMFGLTPSERMQLVYRLTKKNRFTPLKQGVYLFSPLETGPSGRAINEFLVPRLYFPKGDYYIGYFTMFNYYSFTEQIPQVMTVLNTAYTKEKVICGVQYKFIKIPKSRMYGIEKIVIDNKDVLISDRERTLVDMVYFNAPVSGLLPAMRKLYKIIRDRKCDIKKFIQYAAQFPNVNTRKSIGLVLDKAGIDEKMKKPLSKSVKNTSVTSLNDSRKGTLNKRWNIIVQEDF